MNMKKIALTLMIIITLTGCTRNPKGALKYQDLPADSVMKDTSYKFTGKSESFGFTTGKVYYKDDVRQLVITNFQTVGKAKNITKMTIQINFGEREYQSMTYYGENIDDLTLDEFLESISVTEYTKTTISGNAFTESTKKSFKKDIKININYCIKDKCTDEVMELAYY